MTFESLYSFLVVYDFFVNLSDAMIVSLSFHLHLFFSSRCNKHFCLIAAGGPPSVVYSLNPDYML